MHNPALDEQSAACSYYMYIYVYMYMRVHVSHLALYFSLVTGTATGESSKHIRNLGQTLRTFGLGVCYVQ